MCQFLFIFFNVHHKKNDNAISRVRAKRERNILLVHCKKMAAVYLGRKNHNP